VALASGEKYELVNAHGESATEMVFEVVSEFFETHGEVLPLDEALASVESYLEEQALKFAKAKKIQAKLTPVATQPKETVPNAERYTSEKVTLNNSLNQSAASQSSRPMTDEERRLKAISLLRWQ
jgi:hypothetical protein